jgi:hypothetical protein
VPSLGRKRRTSTSTDRHRDGSGENAHRKWPYGGKVTPTLPLNPAKEHWVGWWIKVTGLPLMYWNYMLKGHVWFPKHNTAFKGDVA